jgi:peptidoglycan-associated lipoprotein
MKIATFSKLLLCAAILSVCVTGCQKTPKSPTPIFGRTAPAPAAPGPGNPANAAAALPGDDALRSVPIPMNPDGTFPLIDTRDDLSNYNQDRETFKQQTVYFDFDRFNLNSSEIPKAESVANYMLTQPRGNKLLIEGHCDERGTPEYNRALGERRALAVREFLISLGVDPARIMTISYGEDMPADLGRTEAAYARNRRGEFVLLTPKANL